MHNLIPFKERYDYNIIVYCGRNLKKKCNEIVFNAL